MEGILRKALIACAASAALMAAGSASAANLVTNGDFETNGGNGQVGFNTTIAGWSVPVPTVSDGSYTFVWNTGPGGGAISGTTADTTGANGISGNVALYGPDNGGSNLPNTLTVSPDGGAFIGADPAYHNGTISQTITGLTNGAQYILTFDWAGAQQTGFTGATTEGWNVTLGGGATQTTGTVSTPSTGFNGWHTATMTFTADGSSDLLSFLAIGGPSATQPPFALLDSVSLVAAPVPEPATWALMLLGVGALGAGLRARRRELFAAA